MLEKELSTVQLTISAAVLTQTLEVGEMEEVMYSSMGLLVCMSVEQMELSDLIETQVATHGHQECGGVIFLMLMERCRASMVT